MFTHTETITVAVICDIPLIFFFVTFPQYTPHKLMRDLVISIANKSLLFEAISKWDKLYYWLHCPVSTGHSVELHCN